MFMDQSINVLVSHSLPAGPATRHNLRITASFFASREFPWGKSLLVRATRGGQWPSRENRNTLWASQRGASGPRVTLSPATFDEHEGDTITEHRFVNVLSSPCSSW